MHSTEHSKSQTPTQLRVLVSLKSQLYALNAALVREIVRTPEVAKLPDAPGYVRGVINLRGSVMPLVDLRQLIGLESARGELDTFRAMMRQREQEHRDWVDDLMACVVEGREFTRATDADQCAFGKWYATYEAANISISGLLRKFNNPHRAIHATAQRALELAEAGKRDEAVKLVERTRDTVLQSMIALFEELDRLLVDTNREVSVVLALGAKRVAVTADAVESVERFAADSESSLVNQVPGVGADNMAHSVGRRTHDSAIVTILEVDRLLNVSQDLSFAER